MKKSMKEVEVLFFNEYDYLSYKQDTDEHHLLKMGADDLNWNHFYTKRKVKTSIFKNLGIESDLDGSFIEIDDDIIFQDNYLSGTSRNESCSYSFKSMMIHQNHINRLLIPDEISKPLKRKLKIKELGIR